MKVKTSDLRGAALDWAVAAARDLSFGLSCGQIYLPNSSGDFVREYSPSENWSHGGPLLESFDGWGISIMRRRVIDKKYCYAQVGPEEPENETLQHGETALIAACRAVVMAKLGDEVDVPDELCEVRE